MATRKGCFGTLQVMAVGRLQRWLHRFRQAIQPGLDPGSFVADRAGALTHKAVGAVTVLAGRPYG
ncbi:MAG: hypothetical protein IT480_11930 [Gammaproteobacteria bacterium]|nr:hypothetical protein [Gammaproteobacteria bacterium]